jgi:thiol:disulfide interchange protein DsbD
MNLRVAFLIARRALRGEGFGSSWRMGHGGPRPALCALALALLPGVAPAAVDEEALLPIDQAFALSAEAVSRHRIEFRFDIAEGYYLYRHRMGVAGLDSHFKYNPPELPAGEPKHDEFFGDTEIYRDAVTLVQTGAAADGAETLRFEVRYQGCADLGICYPPHKQQVTVRLPPEPPTTAPATAASDNPLARALSAGKPAPLAAPTGPVLEAGAVEQLPLPPEQAFAFEAIAASPTELLLRFTPAPGYYLYRDRSSFRLLDAEGVALAAPEWPRGVQHEDEHFGQVVVYFDQVELPLPLLRSSGAAQTVTLEATFQGCQDEGICYPPMTRSQAVTLPEAAPGQLAASAPPAQASAPFDGGALLLALLLALAGGVVLNLMPCVLPVLSLKALGLAESAGDPRAGRRHALWYTAGVLASFAAVGALVLLLRQAGAALGWGFQLQQPVVVAVLVYVMLAIGLSLSGVFQIGAGLAGFGDALTRRGGPAGDFFTGVLAVVVASPCTAPFMGSALAFAFGAPALAALLVFLALGLGLALPFLLIGFVPALARRLPRPGAWMETFKQAMAFPMYLTAVWLVWVLARQRGADAVGLVLLGATLLALTVWWREHVRERSLAARLLTPVLLALALLPLAGISLMARPAPGDTAEAGALAFSPAALEELRQGTQPVFVNFTADWCITCKLNERAVLGTDAFRAALDAHDAIYMVGDWTDVDPAISAFLDAQGAVGVPFYIVYPGNGGDGEVLPTVLTLDRVEQALAGAAERGRAAAASTAAR